MAAAVSMAGQNPLFSGQMSAQQLFPLLNPYTAQQIIMSQMMSSAANQAAVANKREDNGERLTPEDTVIGQNV